MKSVSTIPKKLGLFVSIKSIHEGLLKFMKDVATLIKLFTESEVAEANYSTEAATGVIF